MTTLEKRDTPKLGFYTGLVFEKASSHKILAETDTEAVVDLACSSQTILPMPGWMADLKV